VAKEVGQEIGYVGVGGGVGVGVHIRRAVRRHEVCVGHVEVAKVEVSTVDVSSIDVSTIVSTIDGGNVGLEVEGLAVGIIRSVLVGVGVAVAPDIIDVGQRERVQANVRAGVEREPRGVCGRVV